MQNKVIAETIQNAGIQQGSPHATQTLTFTLPPKADLEAFLKELFSSLHRLGLSQTDKTDLQAEAETIEAQARKQQPEPSIVRTAISGVKGFLEKVIQTAADAGAVALATGLLDRIKAIFA